MLRQVQGLPPRARGRMDRPQAALLAKQTLHICMVIQDRQIQALNQIMHSRVTAQFMMPIQEGLGQMAMLETMRGIIMIQDTKMIQDIKPIRGIKMTPGARTIRGTHLAIGGKMQSSLDPTRSCLYTWAHPSMIPHGLLESYAGPSASSFLR